MRNELAAVIDRINLLAGRIERGDYPEKSRLENTLTDGYAWALKLDAECGRLERRLSEYAAELAAENTDDRVRELSALARLLARRRRELDYLRGLLAVLRAGVGEVRVA